VPSVIAALAFRGGLLLWMSGMTFVRWDGKRASRLRVFWRSLVTWSPFWLAMIAMISLGDPEKSLGIKSFSAVVCGLFFVLGVLSAASPGRGLADRLAGTWPVPR
jgi:eukaryotic-like serine/threonine-protein kinase